MIKEIIKSASELEIDKKRDYVRAIKEGLFLDERAVGYVSNKLLNCLSIKAPYKKAREIALEGIVNSGRKEEFYLLEADNNCLTGYILNDGGESWNNNAFIKSMGELVSCRKELHPLDYLFRESKLISLFPDTSQIASFSIKNGIFYVDNHAFFRYMKRANEYIHPHKAKKNKARYKKR